MYIHYPWTLLADHTRELHCKKLYVILFSNSLDLLNEQWNPLSLGFCYIQSTSFEVKMTLTKQTIPSISMLDQYISTNIFIALIKLPVEFSNCSVKFYIKFMFIIRFIFIFIIWLQMGFKPHQGISVSISIKKLESECFTITIL